jgi:hypothetical protein
MPCRHQGGEEYSSYSLLAWAIDEVNGQLHAPAALYAWEWIPGTQCLGG